MKRWVVIAAMLSGLLLISTVICGLWLRGSGSLDFHMNLALITTFSVLVTLVLKVRHNKETQK